MNEDYVSYEQAVKLKELGFDWKCTHFYNSTMEFPNEILSIERHNCIEIYDYSNVDIFLYSAPTLYQVQKWLREVKKIIICIGHGTSIPAMYYWYINKPDGTTIDGEIDSTDYDTYEEALSKAIDKVLENYIINGNQD